MALLRLQRLAIDTKGHAASLSLAPGESLAIIGPSGSGKSRFLAAALGLVRAERGETQVEEFVLARPIGSKRATPQGLGKSSRAGSDRLTEALTATGLWEARAQSIASLSPNQRLAAEIAELILSEAPLLAIDQQADALDEWTLKLTMERLRGLVREGRGLVLATNRLSLAAECDWVIALRARQVRFAGRLRDLVVAGEETIEVETDDQPGVRALVEPFATQIESMDEGLRFTASRGQELAAKLLLEGYGDVRAVFLRRKGKFEALQSLIS